MPTPSHKKLFEVISQPDFVLDKIIVFMVRDPRDKFDLLQRLHRACERSVVLKYEDMINDFDSFAEGLTRFIPLRQHMLDELFRQSRPREKEDISSRRRSGKVRGFEDKLKPETIESLNESLAMVPRDFKFHV